MDNFVLSAEPFLGGFSHDFDGTTLIEVTDVSLMSIARPLDGRAALQKAVRAAWTLDLPDPGQSVQTKNGKATLLCLGPDAFFAVLAENASVAAASKKLGNNGYTTDQSENWVTLRIAGPLAMAALERICPIDLHPDAFPPGSFARTSMEHLGAIIMREGADSFMLLSASSSAVSFLHAVETSINYVS